MIWRIVLLISFIIMFLAVIFSYAYTEEPESSIKVVSGGRAYWGAPLYPEEVDEVTRAVWRYIPGSLGNDAALRYVCDPSQPVVLSLRLENTGTQPIQIRTETARFWDFISFEAARLIPVKYEELGEEDEFIKIDGYYKIQPVDSSTFRHEVMQKTFVKEAEGIKYINGVGKGMEDRIPEGEVWLDAGRSVKIVWFVYPAITPLKKEPYVFRFKVDCEQMKVFLPGIATLLNEWKWALEDWDDGEIYLFRTLNESRKLDIYGVTFGSLAPGQTAINWLKPIIERDYPNRAGLWYLIASAYLSMGEYDEGIRYMKKAYDIDVNGQDDLIREDKDRVTSLFAYADLISIAYERKEDYENALYWCSVALDVLKDPSWADIIDELRIEETRQPVEGRIHRILEKYK